MDSIAVGLAETTTPNVANFAWPIIPEQFDKWGVGTLYVLSDDDGNLHNTSLYLMSYMDFPEPTKKETVVRITTGMDDPLKDHFEEEKRRPQDLEINPFIIKPYVFLYDDRNEELGRATFYGWRHRSGDVPRESSRCPRGSKECDIKIRNKEPAPGIKVIAQSGEVDYQGMPRPQYDVRRWWPRLCLASIKVAWDGASPDSKLGWVGNWARACGRPW